jgi:hypothetical protein
MKAVIYQPLGYVERVHALARLPFVRKDDFVHRFCRVGLIVIGGQLMSDVTRVEHGRFGRFAQAVVAVRLYVGERPHHHAEVAIKGFDAPD